MVTLQMLGGLAVKIGKPIGATSGQRKPLMLLAVIAASPTRRVSREKLLGYFWPDAEEERGKNALRQRLFALRRDLAEPELFLDSTDVELNPAVISVDLWDFSEAVAARNVERAAELYKGPFLDGIYLNDLPELERWVEDRRADIAQRAAFALASAGQRATDQGDLHAAVAHWRRLATLDPSSASTAVELMKALGRVGDIGSALNYFRTFETLLREEYGVEPSVEVQRTVEELRTAPQRGVQSADRTGGGHVADEARQQSAVVDTPGVATLHPPTHRSTVPRTTRKAATILVVVTIALVAVIGLWIGDVDGPQSRAALQLPSNPAQLERRTMVLLGSASLPTDSTLISDATKELMSLLEGETLGVTGTNSVVNHMNSVWVDSAHFRNADSIDANARWTAHAVGRLELKRFGPSLSLRLRLNRADRATTVGDWSYVATDSAKVLDGLRSLADSARALMATIGQQFELRHDPRIATPEAARLLREAQRSTNLAQTIELYRAAIRADPGSPHSSDQFATLLNDRSLLRAELLDAADRAYHARGRVRGQELWFESRWFYRRKVYDSAYAAELERTRGGTGLLLGNIRMLSREYAAAEQQYRRMLTNAPFFASYARNLAVALLNQGKFEQVDSIIAHLEANAAPTWSPTQRRNPERLRGYRAETERNYEAVARIAHRLVNDSNPVAQLVLEFEPRLSAARAIQGRFGESDSIAEMRELRLDSLGDHGAAMEVAATRALVLAVNGDSKASRRILEEGLRRHRWSRLAFMDRRYSSVIQTFAILGEVNRARELEREWIRNVPEIWRRVDAREMADARGELALREKNPRQALEHFRSDRGGWCVPCDYVGVARAFDAMGARDSAIVYFDRFIEQPAVERWLFDHVWLAYAYRRSGELYEAAGAREKAIARYEALLALWTNPNPGYLSIRDDVKKRVASLRGGL